MKKPIPFLVLSHLLLLLIFPSQGFGKTPLGNMQSKAKKIAMMLNIAAKEYGLGVENGKVINAAEYEESLAFLEGARQRYRVLKNSSPELKAGSDLGTRFDAILQNVNEKKNSIDTRASVHKLQTELLHEFGIDISKEPTQPVSLPRGKEIYFSYCMSCHGETGHGDGPLAEKLDPKPAVLADPEITGDAATQAFDNFEVISVGVANTDMGGWTDILSENDIWNVAYFIRMFSNGNVQLSANAIRLDAEPDKADTLQVAHSIKQVRSLLVQSYTAYKENRTADSKDLALDAYLVFDKLETALASKDKELGLRLESSFSYFQAEIEKGASKDSLGNLLKEINQDLSEALDMFQEKVGATSLFIQSFSIIVREGFEAILIIAALVTFLIKSKNHDKLMTIYLGAGIGIAASFLTAYLFKEILVISTAKQEVMEGIIMLVAVVLLFGVSYWLVSKIEAHKWQQYITGKVQQAVSKGSSFALGTVAFISVYREGFETVLFYKALHTFAGNTVAGIIPGFFAGCFCLAIIYYLVNQVGLRIPINWFFAFTSVFLYYMAFVFMGKGIHELQGGAIVTLTSIDWIPEITWLGIYPTLESFIGQAILAAALVLALLFTFVLKTGDKG